MLQFKFRYS